MIILMAGLPGTGKSTLARALADTTSGAILSKDQIRAALFSLEDIEYSTAQDDFCMEVMLNTSRYLLQKNPKRKIFLDGRTFSRHYQIDYVIEVANELAQPWTILECTCSEESARRRLDLDPNHPARNRDFSLYLKVKSNFEPITHSKTVIDADQPLDACVRIALAAVE
jgi:predicted kinase